MAGLVLVTGAGGAVGGPLLPAVRARGWRIRCLGHGEGSLHGADEVVMGDLREAATLEPAVDGVDAVLHLAALTHARDPADYWDVNYEGTRRLLAAAKRAGVERFVLVSSYAISFDGGAYSASKNRAEEEVRGSGLPFVIIRPGEVYGPGGGGGGGIDQLIAAAREDRRMSVIGSGENPIAPVHVEDLVAAMAAALDSDGALGNTYTLAGDPLSVRDFAATCARVFGARGRLRRIPAPAVAVLCRLSRFLPLPLFPDQLDRFLAEKPARSADAEAVLGFRSRPLEEGLRELTGGAGERRARVVAPT